MDWGGRAACVVAALHPERVDFLVSANGYLIQDLGGAGDRAPPLVSVLLPFGAWPQGLDLHRRELCNLLWRLWSLAQQTYDRTADSFDNPD
jgi:pimeloyl-ACP methyl ester carboxylesterase